MTYGLDIGLPIPADWGPTLAQPTDAQLREIRAAGCVTQGILLLPRLSWGRFEAEEPTVPWPYLVHYFNEAGTEPYMLHAITGDLQRFDPPRVWHESFKPHYRMTRIWFPDDSVPEGPDRLPMPLEDNHDWENCSA